MWKNFNLFLVLLALTASIVRSEYTWNGSEWVWSESKSPQAPSMNTNNYEGSGDDDRGGGLYAEEDDDDSYVDEYGSGDGGMDEEEDDYSWGRNSQPDQNVNNQNSNNYQHPFVDSNYNQGSPYDNAGINNVNNNGYDSNRGQDNSQIYYTTSRPYFGNEVENTDDIFVDPPAMIPTTTTTTVAPPRDPSISSRPKDTSRSTSFFAQPGTLAAVIGGAVVGLLCAILCVMFVVYRMRKKDEGSYALDEPKRSPTVNAYAKHPSREFYA